jgi:hypothetical protein
MDFLNFDKIMEIGWYNSGRYGWRSELRQKNFSLQNRDYLRKSACSYLADGREMMIRVNLLEKKKWGYHPWVVHIYIHIYIYTHIKY